jgi:hypothetical protein
MALKARLAQAEKALADTDEQLAAAEKQLLAEQEAVRWFILFFYYSRFVYLSVRCVDT